MIISPINNISV